MAKIGWKLSETNLWKIGWKNIGWNLSGKLCGRLGAKIGCSPLSNYMATKASATSETGVQVGRKISKGEQVTSQMDLIEH